MRSTNFASAKTTILVLHNMLEHWNFVCRHKNLTKNDYVGQSTTFCIVIRRVVCAYKHLTISSMMQENTVPVVCVGVCLIVRWFGTTSHGTLCGKRYSDGACA